MDHAWQNCFQAMSFVISLQYFTRIIYIFWYFSGYSITISTYVCDFTAGRKRKNTRRSASFFYSKTFLKETYRLFSNTNAEREFASVHKKTMTIECISSYYLQYFDICLMFYRCNTTHSREFVFRPTAHRTHRQHDGCIPNESKCSVVCEMRSQKRYDPRVTKFFFSY